jgi:ribosome-interacting GTPase 1
MIPHDALINALRSLKFKFKRQADRVEIYKQSGSTLRVEVRRHDWHDETAVRQILRHAKMPQAEIDGFIAGARRTRH